MSYDKVKFVKTQDISTATKIMFMADKQSRYSSNRTRDTITQHNCGLELLFILKQKYVSLEFFIRNIKQPRIN